MMRRRSILVHRYEERLQKLPTPGNGEGFHSGMLGVCNLAFRANIAPDVLFRDLKEIASKGTRDVTDREIIDTIRKGYLVPKPDTAVRRQPKHQPRRRGRAQRPLCVKATRSSPEEQARARFAIHKGRLVSEESLLSLSPLPIPGTDGRMNLQFPALLRALYDPSDRLFIGLHYSASAPYRAAHLAKKYSEVPQTGLPFPFIIANPLTGRTGMTRAGKESFRADACVPVARYVCAEFDSVTLEEQLAFWACMQLPIAALIFSGGKSIHAWIDVRKHGSKPGGLSHEEWEIVVTQWLKPLLVGMGADPHTYNRARLSRLPGYFRTDKQQYQRLLYLNSNPSSEPILKENI